MCKCFIIAEAGVNHNGSVETAKKMVEVASLAGADAVKFQTFKAERLISTTAAKAEYQKKTAVGRQSQLEMVKELELDSGSFRELFDYCRQKEIEFLSSPFDLESVDLLAELGLEIFKIPSGEITNLPFLRKIGGLKRKVILSTGMSEMEEIADALSVLLTAGTEKKDITVLHCNTEYPSPIEDVNLRAMLTIRDTFGVDIGYSDHTLGIEVAVAAAALGAVVIEKHFTVDRAMEGPDHSSSLIPNELAAMVSAIRNVEKALGDGVKRPSPSELKNRDVVRKSIVAARSIKKGEIFSERNITAKRPGDGICPMQWDRVLGKVAGRDFCQDELIEL